ncbi:polyhydroxybutyrate depolymerase [Micromonospora echinofusca]|uniref:Polyhydroxybutyrate depolymerase n=2 Tax=Micromonospora echinofusca TaxID=47858 RepID=A0ABS3W0C1_MICEH|nr:polyhydroxybutyrate depolymerase [Micromonospora echinofusca]
MTIHRFRRAGRRAAGRRAPLVLTAALLVVLGGCRADRAEPAPEQATPRSTVGADRLPIGTSVRTIEVDGRERGYRVYRPASVPLTGPVPLVVMLHGALGTGEQAESSYGWNAEADRGGFLVVYPDGLNRAWAVTKDCCGAPARDGVDDTAFVTRLVTTLTADLPVDPARVYVSGISNGGLLAYRLVCTTDLFAAVGAVATTLIGDCADPAPVSVIHIHGTADRTMPFGGGPGKRDNGGTGRNPVRINGPATTDLMDRWRAVDRCGAPEVTTTATVTTTRADCPDGRSVELIAVTGAGHQWPGSAAANERAQRLLNLDPPSTALNATATIWRFFSAHPRATGG